MEPGPEEVRAEVERIVAADGFRRSERLCRFLRFVVEAGLEGRHEQLKEYVLGVDVYGRSEGFDPRVDSTVRVEAARLRSKLLEYYAKEGRSNTVRIEIPKGGYTPRFERPSQLRAPRRTVRPLLFWSAGLAAIALAAFFYIGFRPHNAAHGVAKPLTTWPGEELQPSLSPDGKQIAMVWTGEEGENHDIYVKPLGEGPRLRLTTDPARERRPMWSPDGRMIAFLRRSGGETGVYIVPAIGGTERWITNIRTFDNALEWLPDGRSLLVAHMSSDDDPSSIYQISLANSERRRVTSPPSQSYGDLHVTLSPDGGTLAIARSISIPASDILIAPLSGGNPRRLTFDNHVITGLAWSSDGRSIVFSSERGGTAGASSLWRISADGSSPVEPVVGAGPRASFPTVSRQGRLLAYQEAYQDTNVWRASTKGGAPELLNSSTREEAHPHCSPDGSRIAFNSNRSGNWEIWVSNTDGKNARQLTSFGGVPASAARWSPDGRWLAFFHTSEGNADIYSMTSEGSSLRRLTTEPSHEEGPSWSNDGKWLYFSSNRSGQFQVWKMSVDDPTRLVQVTRGGGMWPIESPDGKYLYFTRGADIWRMRANGGDEVLVHGPFGGVRAWTPDLNGIYFSNLESEIQFRSESGRITPIVAALSIRLPGAIRGLTLSPDRQWLVYGRVDRRVSDIMLIENFQ